LLKVPASAPFRDITLHLCGNTTHDPGYLLGIGGNTLYVAPKSIMLYMGVAYRRDAKTRGTREEGNGVEGAVPLISGVSGICSPRPRGMAPSSLGTFGGFFSGVAELVSAKQAGVVPPPPGRGTLAIRNGRRRNISA
jgi:hypothetical protein